MVLGLLLTSVGSGQLIARTGRYKVYPIVGTAIMAVALFLLSKIDEHTSTLILNLDFFILGFSLGLVIQVLVIAVQNTADYADLGAATSGVTFFRSIGGAFGVSVFGAIFSNRLASELVSALHGVHLPAGFSIASAQSSPKLLNQLPAAIRDAIRHAYSLALHPVFLTAVPVALVAFVLAWFLREVPLRGAVGAADIGQGIPAAPTDRSSVDEVERALARLSAADIRREGYAKLRKAAGLDLPAGSIWVLTRLGKQGATHGADLARQAGVTVEAGRPCVGQLVSEGLVIRSDGKLALTAAGREAAEKLFTARRTWLRQLVARAARRAGRVADQTVPHDPRCRRGQAPGEPLEFASSWKARRRRQATDGSHRPGEALTPSNSKPRVTRYEQGASQGKPGPAAAVGARCRAGARVRDHLGAA